MPRTLVKFDEEIHIIEEGSSMRITAHQTPIEIAVIADISGPELIEDPQTFEDMDENAERLWKYYKVNNPFPSK